MPDGASPDRFIVRFLTSRGDSAGLGTLVSSRYVVTCAHVINTALGHDPLAQGEPAGRVIVEFPLLPGQARPHGAITVWRPPSTGAVGGDDIAGLILEGDLPDGTASAQLSVETVPPGRQVRVFGYPESPPRPDGTWAFATIRGSIGNGRLQLDSGQDSAVRIQPGFSGSPVYDDVTGRVVGMLSAASDTPAERDSYAISIGQARLAWPEVLSGHWQRAVARRRDRQATDLTIMHVSGPRFAGDSGQSARPLFGPLHRDLTDLAEQHGLRPDLLVVTGDLTDRGLPSEFGQAKRFLTGLADAAEIPRRHVVIVPGPHDVNRGACAAYFASAEAGEREPVPPYWPKWEYYADALAEFYDGTAAYDFTPDEPFTLFEMPDLNVVVAGLNSTIADSHRDSDHHGYLGGTQLGWFRVRLADYQRRGWLRIAAVHHGKPRDSAALRRLTGGSQLAHLLLHDGVPAAAPKEPSSLILPTGGTRYQLLTVRPDSVTRYSRRCLPDEDLWVGDVTAGHGESEWRHLVRRQLTDVHAVFPPATRSPGTPGSDPAATADSSTAGPVPPRRNEFLERVAEATRVRFPQATVTERPEENYLRVSAPRDGGYAEQWPVGVIDGPPSGEGIEAFASGVHARFVSADPSLHSELVFNSPEAPPGLTDRALRHGIRLKSLVEYQGLLDLAPLASAQRERLAADRAYPANLYVEHRYRIVHGDGQGGEVQTGLITQAVDWLGSESARLVMVLGDFGRGKTAFLRQLTRAIPSRLPGVAPVLVELRSLEKGPTLDDLLGQHLIRQGIEDFSQAKLRYMIDSGRMALLFDGFDELELRVGYDSAASYLRTLVNSVSVAGQAKVILTSRTQHFRSPNQVRTAFGQQVESRSASRVVVLEEFSDEQMADFLTRLYDGDERRAAERLGLVRGIGNLLHLAHNPRMLSFIAGLDSGRLRAALDGSGRVNAAGLYEQIIDNWLELESSRQRHRHGRPIITKDERLSTCMALAQRLWRSGDPQLALADLSTEVINGLSDLAKRGFTEEQAAHTIASGSLLIRTEDGAFAFIHQSVMEWLVAKAAALDFAVLATGEITRLTAAFVIDLAGRDTVGSWARRILADPSAPGTVRKNAYLLAPELGEEVSGVRAATRPDGIRLGALDLRGRDLSGQDLTDADLRGATLSGMRLDDTNLAQANLSDADLTGVTMIRGSLRDAVLTGSTWDHSVIIGTAGLPPADQNPELSAAAVPGRDPAEAMFLPPGTCHDVALSPDGSLLAVARGHSAQLIDTASDTTVRVIRGHTMQVTSVAFSPDGRLLATASRDGTARLWNLPSGTERRTLAGHGDWVTAVAFSPDGGSVATASGDGTVRLWDTESGEARDPFTSHHDSVNSLAFSPDGTLLATASSDADARTWNAADGTLRHTFTGHSQAVTAVAFSPDGTLLATGSGDGTVRTWDAAAGTPRSTIAAYPEAVSAVAFSPSAVDGRLLATAHGTRVEILDPVSLDHRASFRERSPLTGVAFSSDGAMLAAASTDRAHIWDLESGAQRITGTRSAAPVTSVAFSPDGRLLVVTDRAGAARTWDTGTGEHQDTFSTPGPAPVTAAAVSPDCTLLATASPDGIIRRWKMATRAQSPKRLRRSPAAVAFSCSGERIAAASLSGAVQSWNVDDTAGLSRHSLYPATAMAFASDGSYLATATADGDSFVYRVSDWSTVATAVTHTASSDQTDHVTAVAVSRDSTLLAVALPDGTVRVWDTTAGTLAATLTGHALPVSSIAFSSDAAMVITGSADGTARIWNTGTGQEHAACTGHCDQIRSVAFSPDGALAATGASDGTARIWNSLSGNPVATLIALPGGGYATLLPDGGYKLTEDADDIWWAVKLRRFGPGELDPHVPGLRCLAPGEMIR